MKHLSYAPLLAFCFLSCGPKSSGITPEHTADLHQRIATVPSPYAAVISVGRDTTYLTPNGVLVAIPAYAFVDEDGNSISGEVEISLTEIFTTAETVLHPISTVTTAGELLASKGMIKVEATQGDKDLSLATGNRINLTFPEPGSVYEDYDLFYGVTTPQGTVEWEIDTVPAATILTSFETYTPPPITMSSPRLTKGQNARQILDAWDEFAKNINNYTKFTEEEMFRYREGNVLVYYRLFEDGELGPHTVLGDISKKDKNLIIRRFDKLPKIDMQGRTDDEQGVLYFSYETEVEKKERIRTDRLEDTFVLSVRKLGWTNCDVFLRLELPVADMKVTRPSDSTMIKLVFSEYRTTVSPIGMDDNEFTFFGVPIGAAVNVVAITPMGDKVQLSITPAVVEAELASLAPAEIMSRQEMVRRLNALN